MGECYSYVLLSNKQARSSVAWNSYFILLMSLWTWGRIWLDSLGLILVTSVLVAGPEGQGFPGGASDKELALQSRRHRRFSSNAWVRKIPWRRKWQPTPVFLLGESHGQRSLAGYSYGVTKSRTWLSTGQQLETDSRTTPSFTLLMLPCLLPCLSMAPSAGPLLGAWAGHGPAFWGWPLLTRLSQEAGSVRPVEGLTWNWHSYLRQLLLVEALQGPPLDGTDTLQLHLGLGRSVAAIFVKCAPSH